MFFRFKAMECKMLINSDVEYFVILTRRAGKVASQAIYGKDHLTRVKMIQWFLFYGIEVNGRKQSI